MNPTAEKTEKLAEAGIHTLARITDDGDNSEPATLCDTSLVLITDDAGQDFCLLALEMDAVASAWLKLRTPKN